MFYHDVILFSLGSIAGLLSGLLGLGGGIVVVPGLYAYFDYLHFPHQYLMHLAAGTSFAIMVFTSLRSLYSHRCYQVHFFEVYRRYAPGVALGVVIGGCLAHFFHSLILKWLFVFIIIMTFFSSFFTKVESKGDSYRSNGWFVLGGSIIGCLSGMLGIGGSVLTIPYLIFCGVSFRSALSTSIAISLTIAVVGLIITTVTGSFAVGLPTKTVGYVYWPAVLIMALGSVLFSPLGVYLSHRTPVKTLKKCFTLFLMVVVVHMILHN